MGGLLDFLRSIWDSIVICRIVENWSHGVRFRRGVPEAKPLTAGVWFHWPHIDRIAIVPIKERFVDLPVQSATTADGFEVTFSANIGYSIFDGVLACTEVHDLEDAMSRIAMGHLHRRIHEWKLAQLMEDLAKLEKSLEGTLTTRVKRWGCQIDDVGITDMVRTGLRCGQVRVYQG